MKPKKTTAPSDSQRDSQDWSKEFDKPNFWPDLKPIQKAGIKDFIQQEKDKSYQAGFQEAVKKMTRLPVVVVPNEFLGKKPPDYGVQPAILIKHLSSLKPTPDQGSEGEKKSVNKNLESSYYCRGCGGMAYQLHGHQIEEAQEGSEEEVEFYDDSNSEQLKKESREDLVIMEMLVNRKKRPVK